MAGANIGFYAGVTIYSILLAIIALYIISVLVNAFLHGLRSYDTYLSAISIFVGLYNFLKFWARLFHLIPKETRPTAPAYHCTVAIPASNQY